MPIQLEKLIESQCGALKITRSEFGYRAIGAALGVASRTYATSVTVGEPEIVSLADHAYLVDGEIPTSTTDPDAASVLATLETAWRATGLTLEQFAVAVGLSAVEFAAYWTGDLPVPAVAMRRVDRIVPGLVDAHRRGWLTPPRAALALRKVVGTGDLKAVLGVPNRVRRDLRSAVEHDRSGLQGWHARPVPTILQWDVLLAAVVEHEFGEAGLESPAWTRARHLYLPRPWVLDGPRLTQRIVDDTPTWLAKRNLYITQRHLESA